MQTLQTKIRKMIIIILLSTYRYKNCLLSSKLDLSYPPTDFFANLSEIVKKKKKWQLTLISGRTLTLTVTRKKQNFSKGLETYEMSHFFRRP